MHTDINDLPAPNMDARTVHGPGWWLAGIVVLGLLLRFWGLAWGLPERIDLHPDEHEYVVQHALNVSWQRPDPGFINYPSFLCYSTALLHGALKRLDPARPDWKAYAEGRAISAAYGTLTILVVFFLARRLGGNAKGALLAALWMALLPLNVWESHVAVTDVMMTFWTLLALLASVRLFEDPCLRRAVWAGLCAGLATGSKYTAAIVCLAPFVALLLADLTWKRRIQWLLVAAACALAACFVVTPFSFLRLGDTLKALAYENAHTHGFHPGFSLPADGWQYHRFVYQFVAAWPFSLGFPLYLAALAGTAWFARRKDRRKWILLAFGAVWFLETGSMTLVPLRYYHPLLALGALFAGMWLGAELDRPAGTGRRRAGLAAVLLVAAYTFAFTWSTARRYPHDTRVAAAQWLKTYMQQDQVLHVIGWKHYQGFPNDTAGTVQEHVESALTHLHAHTVGTNDLIEVSSLSYLRWERHHVKEYMRMYKRLGLHPEVFEPVAKFDSPFLNRDVYGKLDPMFRCYFVAPTLEFYLIHPPPPAEASPAPAAVPAN